MHLPLNTTSHLGEVSRLINDIVAVRTAHPHRLRLATSPTPSWPRLATSYPDFTVRPRIGTDLWLGDRGALSVSATVLDVHEVDRGDTFGYRGRSAPKHGHIVVVSGGTAHGIGLEAPTGDQSLKARAATLARGGMDAVGFVRSPFSIDGKQRLFAEPPHMQASMLFVPSGARVPAGRRGHRGPGPLHRDRLRPRRHQLSRPVSRRPRRAARRRPATPVRPPAAGPPASRPGRRR